MGRGSVCFILPSAYGYFNDNVPAVGGGARQLSFVSRYLTDEFEVHFVVGDYGQPPVEEYDGVVLHRAYRQSATTPVWRKPLQLTRLSAAMYRADADLYLYRGRPFLATVTYIIAKALRSQWVYNLANDPNLDEQPVALAAPIRWLFDRAVRDADAVVTQTDYQAGRLSELYGRSSTTIPSGYPPTESTRSHGSRDSILWVGRLDEAQKRPHLLLDLAEAVPEASFRLVGPPGQDETYNDRIRSRVRDLDNVEYCGRIQPSEIHSYYQDAKALINTSAHEGFPSTFLEAWRYDTPVVSLDVPPSRFATDSADAGYAGGDFDALVELVTTLSNAPKHRAQLSSITYEYFQENLTLDVVADRYRSLFRGLLLD
ncbi:glycosyltransferase family 4 protein [Halosimplex pelagicum]|uniref:Glycosyltransferase family 4 protein n=1 Tax=Halosimplex pelagicum TaxID=869886 RepID=A0A7D5TG62_9EURY|nr:glycosyltransferase family 4 protein [Halosimplex pelagicum]QLH81216.1 glycosyltransferase family 4 protein [Halosimplex pelagicum]